jgi:hypothetical protein
MSLFYSNNEKKQRRYIKENKIRELNQEAQQEIVDAQLEKELGLEKKATNISLLTRRITDKLVGVQPAVVKGSEILLNSINNSKLTELFNKMKTLPDSSLNKTQRLIRDDLKNETNKTIINAIISEAVPNGVDAIKQAVLDALGGTNAENNELVLDMIFKTNKINTKDLSVKNITDKKDKKREEIETKKMSKEDFDVLDKYVRRNELSTLFKKLREKKEPFNENERVIISKLNDPKLIESLNNISFDYTEKGDEEKLGVALMKEMDLNKKQRKEFRVMANEVMGLNKVFRGPGAPTKITKDTVENINKQREKEIENLKKQLKNNPLTKTQKKKIKDDIKNRQNAIINDSNRFNILSSQFSS